MSPRFSGPASSSAGGSHYKNAEHVGHLVVYFAPALRQAVKTSSGVSDAAACERIVCVDCDSGWVDELVFGNVMVPALTDDGAEAVVGRVAQGNASPGRTAPWVLDAPTEDDLAQAEAFFDDDDERF